MSTWPAAALKSLALSASFSSASKRNPANIGRLRSCSAFSSSVIRGTSTRESPPLSTVRGLLDGDLADERLRHLVGAHELPAGEMHEGLGEGAVLRPHHDVDP